MLALTASLRAERGHHGSPQPARVPQADGYEVLSALESGRVGSRAAGGAADLLVDTVPARLGQVA